MSNPYYPFKDKSERDAYLKRLDKAPEGNVSLPYADKSKATESNYAAALSNTHSHESHKPPSGGTFLNIWTAQDFVRGDVK
jgi:hypothetical protein